MPREARGSVKINREECKGCGLCISACPPHCLGLETDLSAYGVHPAHYSGRDCTGCGICFYVCPEPGAITVYRAAAPRVQMRVTAQEEPVHAAAL
ncbi:MAG: ferredoxin family protein [Acidobacteria bacterium]|nr:ferredoxin family protein [Acidobacteriota bacterium]